MITPQGSPRRKKQKPRRAKQLAQWRGEQAAAGKTGGNEEIRKSEKAPAKAKKAAKA